MMRSKNIIAWLLLLVFFFNWQPLFSNQSGAGLNLPEVVVIGEDSARLEGFRDFGLLPKLAPGIKLEPVADNLTLETGSSEPSPKWETAQAQAPGCAYRNAVTASLARGFGGAESYYRSGRQKYIEGLLLEAQGYFKEGLDKFKESELIPDFHYWLGEIDFRQGNYQVARSHFLVVTKSPENHFYHFSCYSLAWLDYREKNYTAAIKWFALAAKSPERRLVSAAIFWESEALFQMAKMDAGRTLLLKLTSEYPDSAEYRAALYRLATLAFNKRDYNLSLDYLTAMPEPEAGSDMLQRQADLARGWCNYFIGKYSTAERLFKQLQSEIMGVDDVVPLAFLGEILAQLKQQKLDLARDVYARRPEILRTAPVTAAALRELSVAFFAVENYTAAAELNEELINSFPETLLQVDDFRRLARLQVNLSEKQKALQTLQSGIDIFRAHGKGRTDILVLELEQAQILYSVADFKSAVITLEPLFAEKDQFQTPADRFQIYLLLARSLNRMGNFPRTLSLLASIPADFDLRQRADLFYERGWAALQSGNFKLAGNDFAAYLTMVKDGTVSELVIQNAELNRAEALFNLHHDSETTELLNQFVARWPQSSFLPRVQNYQGLLALRRGEFEVAKAIFVKLVSSDMELDAKLEAEVLYNLGESFFSLGDFPQAISVYNQLVAKYPQIKLSGKALIRVGESYFNQGKYLKSQLVYLKAKQLWPGGEIDEKASYGMLLLAYNQDKFSYLETEVKSFIKRFPDSSYTVPLMLLLADLYQRQGREADLLTLFQELETGNYADDLKLEAFFRHFKLDLKSGHRVAARDDCLRLLERFPLSKYECDCRLYLARFAFGEGDLKTARVTLDGLAQAGCPDPDLKREVALLKARIYQQVDKPAEARKFYLSVAENRQSSAKQTFIAFSGLGDIFFKDKKFDEALFFYDKARQNPAQELAAGAALKYAATLEAAGRTKSAQKSFLRISYLYPKQNQVVGDALLAALRLARQGKDKTTAKIIVEKLNSLKLNELQRRKFEKLKTL